MCSNSYHGMSLRCALKYVIAVMFAWMFDSMDLMLLLITIKSMAHPTQLNFDLLSVGAVIISVALLTSGIGGMLFGWLADKYGRKRILGVSILLYGIPTLLVGFVHSWIELLVLRFVSGFGVGGAWAAGVTLVAELVDPSERGRAIGIVQCGFPVGFLLAISLSYLIAHTPSNVVVFGNWRLAFIVGAIPAIILAFVVFMFVPESKIWKFRLFEKKKVSLLEVLSNKVYFKRFVIGLSLDFLAMFSYWVYWSWLPTYLEKTYGVGNLSLLGNMVWLAVTQVGALLGYLTYGFIQDHLGRRPSWALFTTIEGIAILASIKLISDIIAGNVNLALFMAVGFGVGYFTGYWSAFGAILSEMFPTDVRTTLSGLIFNIGRSINFISPILVGYLARLYGFALALSISAIANFITAVLVWLLPETKGKDLMF